MRYEEFREQLQDALQNEALFVQNLLPAETIDLSSQERRWEGYIIPVAPGAEPFHVSAKVAFSWGPIDAARSRTCEEDVLMELLGRRQRPLRTVPRFNRVDLELQASLPYGSTTIIPDPKLFGAWTVSIKRKLDDLIKEYKERQGRLTAVLGHLEEVEVEARCNAEGTILLKGLSISGFRLLRVPRVWDDPDRSEAERDAAREFSRFARRFRGAVDEWTGSVAELGRWIRYAPPAPDVKQVEPWFGDDQEDEGPEDGGPETIH